MATKKHSGTTSVSVTTPVKNWPSFITQTRSGPRQRDSTYNFFTVPAESYGDGWITGMKAAIEYLDFIRVHQKGTSGGPFLSVVEDAVIAQRTEGGNGAAIGFLRMLEDMICFAAMHASYADHIGSKIARQYTFESLYRVRQKVKGQAFYERMQAAKAAKKRATESVAEARRG